MHNKVDLAAPTARPAALHCTRAAAVVELVGYKLGWPKARVAAAGCGGRPQSGSRCSCSGGQRGTLDSCSNGRRSERSLAFLRLPTLAVTVR